MISVRVAQEVTNTHHAPEHRWCLVGGNWQVNLCTDGVQEDHFSTMSTKSNNQEINVRRCEESLADLNIRRAAEALSPVPMERFRPNLVVRGCVAPYVEDGWKAVRALPPCRQLR